MGRLDGKIAIVTGAAQGIGNGSARVLAKNGATVILAMGDGRKAAQHMHEMLQK